MIYFTQAQIDFVYNMNIVRTTLYNVQVDVNTGDVLGSDFYGFPTTIKKLYIMDFIGSNENELERRNLQNATTRNRKIQPKKPSKRVYKRRIGDNK